MRSGSHRLSVIISNALLLRTLFFSSSRRHTRFDCDWSSDVCSSDLARVRSIDRAARAVVMDAGERIPYDALVLATGSVNRVLPMFPPGPGLYYLRTAEEARADRKSVV